MTWFWWAKFPFLLDRHSLRWERFLWFKLPNINWDQCGLKEDQSVFLKTKSKCKSWNWDCIEHYLPKSKTRNNGQKQVKKCIYWSLGLRRWEIPQPPLGAAQFSTFYSIHGRKRPPSVTQCPCMCCGHTVKSKNLVPRGLGMTLVTGGLLHISCFKAIT